MLTKVNIDKPIAKGFNKSKTKEGTKNGNVLRWGISDAKQLCGDE